MYFVCNCTVSLYNIRAISLSDVNTLFEQRCQKCNKASHQCNSLPNFIKQVVYPGLF